MWGPAGGLLAHGGGLRLTSHKSRCLRILLTSCSSSIKEGKIGKLYSTLALTSYTKGHYWSQTKKHSIMLENDNAKNASNGNCRWNNRVSRDVPNGSGRFSPGRYWKGFQAKRFTNYSPIPHRNSEPTYQMFSHYLIKCLSLIPLLGRTPVDGSECDNGGVKRIHSGLYVRLNLTCMVICNHNM